MSLRRSGRKRVQSLKAAHNTQKVLAEILSDSDGPVVDNDSDSAEDAFAPVNDAEETEQDEDISAAEDASNASNDDGDEEQEAEDDVSDVVSQDDLDNAVTYTRRARYTRKDGPVDPDLHIRGVTAYNRHWVKHHSFRFTLGDDEAAAAAYSKMRKKFDTDRVLPSRRGMAHSFFQSEQERSREANEAWTWYFERGGQTCFRSREAYEDLAETLGRGYLGEADRTVLLGTRTDESLHHIPVSGTASLGKSSEKASTSNQTTSGFVIHAGECLQSLAWAPNKPGSMQYLALSTMSKTKGGSAFSPTASTPSAIQIWSFKAMPKGSGAATIDMITLPKLVKVLCCEWGRIRQLRWCPAPMAPREGNVEEDVHLGLLAVVSSDGRLRVLDVSCKRDITGSTQYTKVTRVAFESRAAETVFTSVTWNTSTTLTAGCANGYVAVFNLAAHVATSPDSNAKPHFYYPIHTSYIHTVTSSYPTEPYQIATSSADGNLILTDLRAPNSDNIAPSRHRLSSHILGWHTHLGHVIYGDDSANLRTYNPRQFFNGLVTFQAEGSLGVADSSPVHATVVVGMLDGAVWLVNPTMRVVSKGERGKDKEYSERGGKRSQWLKHDWRRGKPVDESTEGPEFQDEDDSRQQDTTESGNNVSHEIDSIESQTAPGLPNGHTTSEDISERANGNITNENAPSSPADQRPDTTGNGHDNVDYPHGLSTIRKFSLRAQVMYLASTARKHASINNKHNAKAAYQDKSFMTIYEEESGARAAAWNPNIEVGGWCAVGFGDGLVVVDDLCGDEPGRRKQQEEVVEEEAVDEEVVSEGDDMDVDEVYGNAEAGP